MSGFLIFSVFIFFTIHFVRPMAEPQNGVVSIYLRTPWHYPLSVEFFSDNFPVRSHLMQHYRGPDATYSSEEWKYVEIPGSANISVSFKNEKEQQTEWTALPSAGVFILHQNGESVRLATSKLLVKTPGCPRIFSSGGDNLLCSGHGKCEADHLECECQRGWTLPRCNGQTCQSGVAMTPIGVPSSVIGEVFHLDLCCARCDAAPPGVCKMASYNAKNFTCVFYSSWSRFSDAPLWIYTLQRPVRPHERKLGVSSLDVGVAYVVGVLSVVTLILGAIKFATSLKYETAYLAVDDDDESQPGVRAGPSVDQSFEAAGSTRLEGLDGSDLLQKYRLHTLLGFGAFSRVYLVSLRSPNPDPQMFAMKVIQCRSDHEMSKAFHEFQSLKRLQGHRGIVRLVDMLMSYENIRIPGPESTAHSHTQATSDDSFTDDAPEDRGPRNVSFFDEFVEAQMPQDRRGPESSGEMIESKVGFACLIMQYYEEGTLESGIRNTPEYFCDPSRVIAFFHQLLSALVYSHARNIIHLDLKPGNVLLTEQRTRCILSDFGMARVCTHDHSMTDAGGGTLFYQAPEQIRRCSSKKSDVWGLACIIVAMITGRVGKRTTPMFFRRVEQDFEDGFRKEMASGSIPLAITELLLNMLEMESSARPTMKQCLEIITSFSA